MEVLTYSTMPGCGPAEAARAAAYLAERAYKADDLAPRGSRGLDAGRRVLCLLAGKASAVGNAAATDTARPKPESV